jgi:hypothetical protein
MIEPTIIRPEIPLEDFFAVFMSSALVIVLGLGYVGIYTLVRIGKLKNIFMPFAYVFWCAQTYCLYYLGVLLSVEAYTQNVLFGAMVGFLLVPHFIYFLMEKTHEVVKH